MLDNFIYEDHFGRRFIGKNNGVFVNYNNLRDYLWEYDTINNRISHFHRGITDRNVPLVVCNATEAKTISVMNTLHDLAETDIVAKIPGKIYIGDWYTCGYVVGSQKTDYLINKRLCNLNLTYVSDDPFWYREKLYRFTNLGNDIEIVGGKDYPYDYPYDYVVSLAGQQIVNESLMDNEFRLQVYGSCENPSIMIGDHEYCINATLAPKENLLIDSINKTITLTKVNGTKENWFDKRNRENYIFQPIPGGKSNVVWNGAFGFDLTVIEKRSEPKWT